MACVWSEDSAAAKSLEFCAYLYFSLELLVWDLIEVCWPSPRAKASMLGSAPRAHWPLLRLLPVRLWQCFPLLLLYGALLWALGSGTGKCPLAAGPELLLTLTWKNPSSNAGTVFPDPHRPAALQRGQSWITTKEQIFHIWVHVLGP